MRLIDGNALLKYFSVSTDGSRFPLHDCDNFPTQIQLKEAQDAIRNAPTIDAVPVVRCGECRHSAPHPTDNARVFCLRGMNGHLRMKKYDFCSYGERKDGEK